MSSDWWIIPTVAIGCLAVLGVGVWERWGEPGERPHRVSSGGLAGALLLLSVVAFVGPVWDGCLRRGNQDLCERHLLQLGFSLLLYVQDYDERFPPSGAWCEAAEPTLSEVESFRCPADRSRHGYSYAMNAALGRKTFQQQAVERVVLLFESDQGERNASGGEGNLASVTRHNPFHLMGLSLFRPNPAYSGHFFAFGDGHVKWLTPAERQAAGKALWRVP